MLRALLIILILSVTVVPAHSQLFQKNVSRKIEKKLFTKKSGNRKSIKVKEPRKVLKSKKKQEANEKKLKRDYEKSIKKSQKRTFDIQTPDVKERMKQNEKDTAYRDKSKKRKIRSDAKKAGRKYN